MDKKRYFRAMSKSSKLLDQFFQSRIATHIAFWVVTVLLLSYYSSLFGGNFGRNLIEMAIMLPLQMVAAYLLVYVQIPRLLYQKRWFLFLLSFILTAYCFSTLSRLTNIYIVEPLTGYEGYDESLWEVMSDPVYLLKVYMPWVYTSAVLLLIFKMVKDRFQQENRLNILEKEKSKAELDFLKAQMNPHFLFNTLNNIYSLSKDGSDQTSEMILKLSELLDYTIYECNETTVPIYKEWQLIQNYVDLQAVRHGEKLMIVIDQQIDNEDTPIAPLILISLVENAFKHSLLHDEKRSMIKILLKVEQKVLTFEVINNRSKNALKKTATKKGIGVPNIKKQLNLLYPNRHKMKVEEELDLYKVTLTINP